MRVVSIWYSWFDRLKKTTSMTNKKNKGWNWGKNNEIKKIKKNKKKRAGLIKKEKRKRRALVFIQR
jgi:hypothetical protein